MKTLFTSIYSTFSPNNFFRNTTLIAAIYLLISLFSPHLLIAQPANVCPFPGKNCSQTPLNGNLNLTDTLYAIAAPQRLSYSRSPKNPNMGDVKYILNGNAANLGTNYFSDCPNTRVKCSAKTTTCP